MMYSAKASEINSKGSKEIQIYCFRIYYIQFTAAFSYYYLPAYIFIYPNLSDIQVHQLQSSTLRLCMAALRGYLIIFDHHFGAQIGNAQIHTTQ